MNQPPTLDCDLPSAEPAAPTGEFDLPHEGRTDTVTFCIVTPTLNAAEYIDQCLASVANQTGPGIAIRHLVLDGGSTDDTLQRLVGKPVTLVPRRRGSGLIEAMRTGFEAATGDLILFLGADDLLLPGALQAVAAQYRREQRPVLFCRTRWVDRNLRSLGELTPPPQWLSAATHASLGWCYISASAAFIAPATYRALGGFDLSYQKFPDYDFFSRILHQKIPFSRVDHAVSVYRRHDGNDSLMQDASFWADMRLVESRFAPSHFLERQLRRLSLKTWVYARHPAWAYHQIMRKIAQRRILG